MNWLERIPEKLFLLLAVAFFVGWSASLFLRWPPPLPDEGLFASAARTLITDGHLGTTQIRGQESHVYWQPPVYFLSLVPVIKVGGYSLVALRVWSLAVGVGILFLLHSLTRALAGELSAKIALLILVCDPRFVNAIAYARMDGLCMVFILSTIFLSVRPLFANRLTNALAAGTTAALAALTHPYGLVAPLAGFLFLFIHNERGGDDRPKRAGFFVLPIVVGFLMWGLYIIQDLPGFKEQLVFQFTRKDRGVMHAVAGFVGHYRSYPMSLLIPVAGCILLLREAMRKNRQLIPLAVAQALIVVVSFFKFEVPYHVYLAPLGAAGIAMVVGRVGTYTRTVRTLMVIFIAVVCANALGVAAYLNYQFNSKLRDATDYQQFGDSITVHLPPGSVLIGWGTPSLYWALQSNRPDIIFRDNGFFNDTYAGEAIREADFFISTRSFRPDDDLKSMDSRRRLMTDICERNGRALVPVTTVGKIERFAYSAEIYAITAKGNR
jgi:4-amino-4-deoxy-L-arabinose transferase-like glycosyltransferase